MRPAGGLATREGTPGCAVGLLPPPGAPRPATPPEARGTDPGSCPEPLTPRGVRVAGTAGQVTGTTPPLVPPAAKRLRSGPRASRAGTQDGDGVPEAMLLVASLSEEQLTRYEVYRRAAFPRAAVKRLVQRVAGGAVSQNVAIAMSGLAKVFVGEVVEAALDVCEQWGDAPPLQPRHLREAVRRLNSKGHGPHAEPRKF